MPLETSTVPGLRLTGRHKVRPLGEPILTYITGDPGTWFKLYHIVKVLLNSPQHGQGFMVCYGPDRAV